MKTLTKCLLTECALTLVSITGKFALQKEFENPEEVILDKYLGSTPLGVYREEDVLDLKKIRIYDPEKKEYVYPFRDSLQEQKNNK